MDADALEMELYCLNGRFLPSERDRPFINHIGGVRISQITVQTCIRAN